MYNTTNSIKAGECQQSARFTLFRTIVFVVRGLYTRFLRSSIFVCSITFYFLLFAYSTERKKNFPNFRKFNWNTLLIENLIGESRWLEEERKSFPKLTLCNVSVTSSTSKRINSENMEVLSIDCLLCSRNIVRIGVNWTKLLFLNLYGDLIFTTQFFIIFFIIIHYFVNIKIWLSI